MKQVLEKLNTLPELRELLSRIDGGGCPAEVTGLQGVHRALAGAALSEALDRPALFVCADEGEARTLREDLKSLLGTEPVLLLGREWQLRPGAIASRGWEQDRLAALYALGQGGVPAVVATADGLMARTLPKAALLRSAHLLKPGQPLDLPAFTEALTAAGYARCQQVEGVGQFAVRGGILDVFSPLMEKPVRCELFGDEIDSMGLFDPASQRRVQNVTEALILPCAEVLPHLAEGGLPGLADAMEAQAKRLRRRQGTEKIVETILSDAQQLRGGVLPGGLDRYHPLIHPQFTTALDYLDPASLVFLCEGGRIDQRAKTTLLQLRQEADTLMEAGCMAGEGADLLLSENALYAALSDFPAVMMDALPTSRLPLKPRSLLHIDARQLSSYGGSLETAAADMEHYRKSGSGVLVLCGGETRAKNLLRILEERGIPAVLDLPGRAMPAPGEVRLTLGALSAGSEWPSLNLAILTEGQLLSVQRKRPARTPKESNRQKLQSYTDLKPGDLVVHVHHGIGRFAGIHRLPTDGVEKDYIKLDYAAGDCLYVPVTQLDMVSKYIGGGEDAQERTRLNKLGGTEWTKQKSRAKAAVKDLAKGLIQLYAQRARQPGFAFSPDSAWQQEFEDAFPYPETEDQLRAIREIKTDMEKPRPMDRLLCGDVGYGKTEVALRAVMKCILDGKQAAILVPTTVLAQQHYATAQSRFRSFPVTIEVLSRFTTPKEQKRILSNLAEGRVDLIIGTHKLIQKSVKFHDLGLLVIDEEQRFGVSHKEKLREMARQVDTLTLSATPIPRTLNMSLSGLRDMSTLEEPPRDRQAVQTYVLEEDWGVLADACRRELDRGGQVYFLHNRVESIDRVASRLQKLLGPETRIAIGHGQMGEQELSNVMRQMVEGEADILVCTTIIETGIDIPNVNTLIVEDADRMGLAQLHQLRGRIGRSARRAYAYLTYRPGKILQEAAAKRLAAIREYVEFGSGFRIAMRDLEIRGAGNLLGPQQSGTMMSVGYDLYLKLLEEAVLEEKGETRETARECAADLTVNANIPEKYVPSAQQRMDLYRRIASIRTNDDASDVLDELIDRYGDPPPSVSDLVNVSLVRVQATAVGVYEVTQKKDTLVLQVETLDVPMIRGLLVAFNGRVTAGAGSKPYLSVTLQPDEKPLDLLQGILKAMAEILGTK